jgi:hypothetical protein
MEVSVYLRHPTASSPGIERNIKQDPGRSRMLTCTVLVTGIMSFCFREMKHSSLVFHYVVYRQTQLRYFGPQHSGNVGIIPR